MAVAVTCPAHEGMHLRENMIIAEIVDSEGNVLPKGNYGELVLTTVGMEAMPLIRYRTGDYTRILPGPCACGSETVRLDTVQRKTSGLSAPMLDEILFSDRSIVDCCYVLRGSDLEILALTHGRPEEHAILPRLRAVDASLQVSLVCRPVRPEDRALYTGKRRIHR